jgi:hypothetical protein
MIDIAIPKGIYISLITVRYCGQGRSPFCEKTLGRATIKIKSLFGFGDRGDSF